MRRLATPSPLLALFYSVLLLSVTALLHGQVVLDGWWRFDDPTHLDFATALSPAEYFFSADHWREISPVNFTPLLPFSFAFSHALWGFDPQGFYLHQLSVIWLCALATMLLLSRWLNVHWGFIAGLLLLVSPPVFYIAEQLMTRHYAEGLLLTVLSLWLFTQALGSPQRWPMAYLGAFCYLLAMLAKEVYAPLVGLLVFLPLATLRWRLFMWLPYLVVALLYIVWRQLMLESTGGYGLLSDIDPLQIAQQFARLPRLLLGDSALATAGVAVIILGFIGLWGIPFRRGWRGNLNALGLALLVAGLVLLPLVPLTAWPGIRFADRYLLLPYWALSIAVVWGLANAQRFTSRLPSTATFALAMILVVALGARTSGLKEHWAGTVHAFETQSRHIWHADGNTVVWLSPELSATLWEHGPITTLRERAGNGPAPTLYADEIQLIAPFEAGTLPEVWAYQPACGCMREITAKIPARLAAWQAKLTQNAPFEARIITRESLVRWEFNSTLEGHFSLVGSRVGHIPIPAQGQLRTSLPLEGSLVRFETTGGEISYARPFIQHN